MGGSLAQPQLLAHALHSQIDMHRAYGGVVPELASRDHIRRVIPLARQVLEQGGRTLEQLNVIAYTQGPGLAGALLVGAGVACSLAFALVASAFGSRRPAHDLLVGVVFVFVAWFVFDRLLGVQEIVVKPVPKYIQQVSNTKGITGCTLLGDGSISLILDAQSLAGEIGA